MYSSGEFNIVWWGGEEEHWAHHHSTTDRHNKQTNKQIGEHEQ